MIRQRRCSQPTCVGVCGIAHVVDCAGAGPAIRCAGCGSRGAGHFTCMRACHSKLLEPRSQHVRTCSTVVTVLLSNLMFALQELLEQFGIVFNSLLCLNNMPIKRWADHLVKE